MSFNISLGPLSRCYVARVTNAPRRYDSGSTITLGATYSRNGQEGRLVLIPENEIAWHNGRYGSGLYWIDELDDTINDRAIAELLQERLNPTEQNRALRLRWKQLGGHVHCRLFTAPTLNHTFQKSGDLVFTEVEWPAVRALLERADVEILDEEVPQEV